MADQSPVDLPLDPALCSRAVTPAEDVPWDFADAMPQIVWTARPDGWVEGYNRRWTEYTGLPAAESLGWAWIRAMHPHDLPKAMAAWQRCLATGADFAAEYRIRRASDGVWRWHLGQASPKRATDGSVIRWIGTATDIHARWESEAALQTLAAQHETGRQHLETIIQTMIESVLVIDGTGVLLAANPSALALHGFSDLAAMQAAMPTLAKSFDTRSADGTPMEGSDWPGTRALRGETVAHLEVHVQDRTTGRAWVGSFSATPLHGPDGAVRQAVVTIHDITAERSALQERERLLAELRQAVAARDEFLSVASHELNTPLTPLSLLLDTLVRAGRQGELAQDSARSLERLELAARQVARLVVRVASLLDVSRITSGTLRLDLEDLDLAEIAREVAERFKDDLTAARCTFTLDAPVPVRGRWDGLRLDQVVTNLLSNALKYGAGGPVVLSVHGGACARLTVRDHGMGIAVTDQARIFERFERAVPTRHYGGLGLGLWITRRIVAAMGGTVTVASSPDEGSTFTVALPFVAPDAPPRG